MEGASLSTGAHHILERASLSQLKHLPPSPRNQKGSDTQMSEVDFDTNEGDEGDEVDEGRWEECYS